MFEFTLDLICTKYLYLNSAFLTFLYLFKPETDVHAFHDKAVFVVPFDVFFLYRLTILAHS